MIGQSNEDEGIDRRPQPMKQGEEFNLPKLTTVEVTSRPVFLLGNLALPMWFCETQGFVVSRLAVRDMISARTMPLDMIGDAALAEERVSQYMRTASHINTQAPFALQNSGLVATLALTSYTNDRIVMPGNSGFRWGTR